MPNTSSQAPSALVVEDEYLIALDAVEALRDMGIRVTGRVASVDKARNLIEREPPDFAILDLNLKRGGRGEELVPVLSANGCACLFLSGDETALQQMQQRFPQWPALQKPAGRGQIAQAVRRLVSSPESESVVCGSA